MAAQHEPFVQSLVGRIFPDLPSLTSSTAAFSKAEVASSSHDLGSAFMTQVVAAIAAQPSVVVEHLQAFLQQVTPAAASDASGKLSSGTSIAAVAFTDYSPVHFKAFVSGGESSVLSFTPTSRSDVVRFRRFCALALRFLESQGLRITSDEARLLACSGSSDLADYFDSFDFESETSADEWRERIEDAVSNLSSRHAAVREESAQALWRWADTVPNSCRVMSDVFAEHGDIDMCCFGRQPEEQHPISEALRLATGREPVRPACQVSTRCDLLTLDENRQVRDMPQSRTSAWSDHQSGQSVDSELDNEWYDVFHKTSSRPQLEKNASERC